MFQRKYQVKGEDVNAVMLMQNYAYVKYASKILETFLLSNGYSGLKLNQLNVFWQKSNEQLFKFKNLFFTHFFDVELEVLNDNYKNNKQQDLKITFFNDKNEKCAQITTSIIWHDLFSLKQINTPKRIEKYFTGLETFAEVV